MADKKIFNGLIWTFLERIIAQVVSMIVTIILARILSPSHYGTIAIVTVFISFCDVFVSSGFGSAIVQKKNASTKTFNTAFTMSFGIAMLLYIILFLSSNFIAKYYQMPELILILRIMGLRLPLASLNSIQQAYVQRDMDFKKFFISTSIGTIISAIIGITMAYCGFGIWSLVAQYLVNSIVDTIMLFFITNWKPKFEIAKNEAYHIFSFGWKVLASNLVFTIETDIRSLIIGKVFGSSDLAYYDQGKKYPSLLVSNINTSINKVMLPAFSKSQDNIRELKETLRKAIRLGIYLLSPILIGFAVISENFIIVILTSKWIDVLPYMQLFSVAYLTKPLEAACHQSLLAIGKSNEVLKAMVIINITSLLMVCMAVFWLKNVIYIAVGSLLTSILSFLYFMFLARNYLEYNPKEQMIDILPSLIISLIMGLGVKSINIIDMKPFYSIIVQLVIGIILYTVLSKLFHIRQFEELSTSIIKILKSRNKVR